MTRVGCLLLVGLLLAPAVHAAGIVAIHVEADNAVFETPDPRHEIWQRATPVTVALLPQTITPPSRFTTSVASVEVRAVHNGTWIALIVRWADPTQDETSAAGVFPDAVAVGLPLKDPAITSPFMGQPGAGVEVNYWKALWQRDLERGYQDVTDLHPHTAVDLYWQTSAQAPYPVQEVLATPEARQWLPAVANSNPMSQLHRRTPVEQLIAEGFGTLTTQQHQDARGAGIYRDGTWTVVLTRPLVTGDASDANLKPGMTTAMNLAVWDGSSGDRSGQKNYAMWTPLKLEAAK